MTIDKETLKALRDTLETRELLCRFVSVNTPRGDSADDKKLRKALDNCFAAISDDIWEVIKKITP